MTIDIVDNIEIISPIGHWIHECTITVGKSIEWKWSFVFENKHTAN